MCPSGEFRIYKFTVVLCVIVVQYSNGKPPALEVGYTDVCSKNLTSLLRYLMPSILGVWEWFYIQFFVFATGTH